MLVRSRVGLWRRVVVGFLWIVSQSGVIAAPAKSVDAGGDVVAMSPAIFAGWMAKTRESLEAKHQPPELLERKLMERLRSGRYVTDEAVLSAVNAWNFAESPGVWGRSESAPHPFTRTMRLIDALQPFTRDRPELAARLHEKKAMLYGVNQDLRRSATEYSEALDLLTPLHLEVDIDRMDALVGMAGAMFAQGEKKKAEGLYLEALSYPWYLVRDPKALQTLRDQYIQAGRGLIDCRRGNLAALKEIFFVPATEGDLGPVLEAAIRDAQAAGDGTGKRPATKTGGGEKGKGAARPKRTGGAGRMGQLPP